MIDYLESILRLIRLYFGLLFLKID